LGKSKIKEDVHARGCSERFLDIIKLKRFSVKGEP